MHVFLTVCAEGEDVPMVAARLPDGRVVLAYLDPGQWKSQNMKAVHELIAREFDSLQSGMIIGSGAI